MSWAARVSRRADSSSLLAVSSLTAPIRGVTVLDLLCVWTVHHLGVVHDGVIFSERVDRD
jgi:hypothetical protein